MSEQTIRDKMWIGNEWADAKNGGTFASINPATHDTIAEVASGQPEDIDRAVESARAALSNPEWRDMNPHKRSRLLWKLADAVQVNADELGALETADNGKPYFESRKVDLPSVIENLRYFAGLANKIEGATIPVAGPFLNYTLREPVGVVGCITPWNFPLSLATWKVAPALAGGTAVILKPAEQTPLSSLRLAELAADVGFPSGDFNVVPGFGDTAGAALVAHAGVDAVALTGSTDV